MGLVQQIGDAEPPLGARLFQPAVPLIGAQLPDVAGDRTLHRTAVSGEPNLVSRPSERRATSRWCPEPDAETVRLALTR
jgi:hypothetical protein